MACLARDNEEYGIDLNNINVVDAKTEKHINAKDAFYVVGSKIKGTMSKVSKLGFAKKEDAVAFAKENGGEVENFQKVFNQAKSSLKADNEIIKTKKKKKVYPKGKKIFDKRCDQEIDPTMYLEINELKADIKNNNLCKKIK